jgi:hypothetical protein
LVGIKSPYAIQLPIYDSLFFRSIRWSWKRLWSYRSKRQNIKPTSTKESKYKSIKIPKIQSSMNCLHCLPRSTG